MPCRTFKIAGHNIIQQRISVNAGNELPGTVVMGDIGGGFRQNVSNDLFNRTVAPLTQDVVDQRILRCTSCSPTPTS